MRKLTEKLRDPEATDAGLWTGSTGLFAEAAARIEALEVVVEKLLDVEERTMSDSGIIGPEEYDRVVAEARSIVRHSRGNK